jgi:cytochrome c peroxidase
MRAITENQSEFLTSFRITHLGMGAASGKKRVTMQRASLPLISALALTWVCSSPVPSVAQTPADDAANNAWQLNAMMAMQRMRAFHDVDTGTQPTPPVIPQNTNDADPSGTISTFQPDGDTQTSGDPFFQNLGTNERTCFTCHQPQTGWTVSAQSVQARFNTSLGADPIFRLVDGATCPTDDVSTPDKKLQAYSLLLNKGLIRIGLAIPANAEFTISVVSDPYSCNTNPATGLNSPTNATSGIVSIYRRPLPSTNLGFLSTIMWDGREPNLSQQAVDATNGHAAANPPGPSPAQVQQIVNFESDLFTAQSFDNAANNLDADGAMGGAVNLQGQLASFFIGINDPLGKNPTGAQFNPNIFNLFQAWSSLLGTDAGGVNIDRESVARGETLFNTTKINITGVGGLNDVLGVQSIPGFCGTCHDTPNVGNHSVKAPLNIGIANAGSNSPPALDISGLPVFSLNCSGQSFLVTDPGRALISGNCADIGKIKGPILRGLAARAPYFHNGSAATLMDVVNFYDQRFSIGFTPQQKQDLVNFLNTL